MAKSLPHLWRHPQKTRSPHLIIFKTCRVFWGFGKLSRTIDWQVMEMQSGGNQRLNAWFQSTTYWYTGSQRVSYIDSDICVGKVPLEGAARLTACSLQTIWCCLHLVIRAFYMHLSGLKLPEIKIKWKLTQKISRHYGSSETHINACYKWRHSSTQGWYSRVLEGRASRLRCTDI